MHSAGEHASTAVDGRTLTASNAHPKRDRVVLVVNSNREDREALVMSLGAPGLRLVQCGDAAEALSVLRGQSVDLVISASHLGSGSGTDFLESARMIQPDVPRILVASETVDMPEICGAINRAGISHLMQSPLDPESIDRIRLDVLGPIERSNKALRPSDHQSPGSKYGIIGTSPAIRSLIDLIEKVGPTDSTVLVTGETGTGKELVGQAIHDVSLRRNGVFSAINSAALPENLLESELFGHRRGAFTGAATNRRGLFEHTHQGTVFLDELGEMPLTMQAKLLRFLQTGEVRPVGGETSRYVDVRLVSATNRDLEKEVLAGRFREDLFYRLAVIPISVPPLRERVDDIPLLANHFLRTRPNGETRSVGEIEPDAMDALMRHSWPGNVRELQNVIERGVALCSNNRIRYEDLPTRILTPSAFESHEGIQSLPKMERKHILETLDKVGWNRKQAAQLLQISTTTLWRRLKEFGIDEADRRASVHHHVSSSL